MTAVKRHLLGYIMCFDTIANNDDGRWTRDVQTADGFATQLGGFEFNYWLSIFDLVFKATDSLYHVLQSLKLNIGWARSQVDNCIKAIRAIKDKANAIYEEVASEHPPPNKR